MPKQTASRAGCKTSAATFAVGQVTLSEPRLFFSCSEAEAGHEHRIGELQGCKIALIPLTPSKKQPLSTTP